jgi:hypothetical protein
MYLHDGCIIRKALAVVDVHVALFPVPTVVDNLVEFIVDVVSFEVLRIDQVAKVQAV